MRLNKNISIKDLINEVTDIELSLHNKKIDSLVNFKGNIDSQDDGNDNMLKYEGIINRSKYKIPSVSELTINLDDNGMREYIYLLVELCAPGLHYNFAEQTNCDPELQLRIVETKFGDNYESNEEPIPEKTLIKAINQSLRQFNKRHVGFMLALRLPFVSPARKITYRKLSVALDNMRIDCIKMIRSGTTSIDWLNIQRQALGAQNSNTKNEANKLNILDEFIINALYATACNEPGSLTKIQANALVKQLFHLMPKRKELTIYIEILRHWLEIPQHELPVTDFAYEEIKKYVFTGVFIGSYQKLNSPFIDDFPMSDFFEQLDSETFPYLEKLLLSVYQKLIKQKGEVGASFERSVFVLEHLLKYSSEIDFIDLVRNIYRYAYIFFRDENVEQAQVFLSLITGYSDNQDFKYSDVFVSTFRVSLKKLQARIHQSNNQFKDAKILFDDILSDPNLNRQGLVLTYRGLVEGEFPALASVLPTHATRQESEVMVNNLSKGIKYFNDAVKNYPESSIDAAFCLGVISCINEDYLSAINHLKKSYMGMLESRQWYSKRHIFQWNSFLLALSLYEQGKAPEDESAKFHIEAIFDEHKIFPTWLWEQMMLAVYLNDDNSMVTKIGNMLLETNPTDSVYESLWQCELPISDDMILEKYIIWLRRYPQRLALKSTQLKELLCSARSNNNVSSMETIIETMEELAVENSEYRDEYITILSQGSLCESVLSPHEIILSKVRIYEMSGDNDMAISLLSDLVYSLICDNSHTLLDVTVIINWLKSLGADIDWVDELASTFLSDAPVHHDSQNHDCPVSVLYIGGNETQMQYENDIRTELNEEYPNLTVEFYFPGWRSNWSKDFDSVITKIKNSDVVVLNSFVRTIFGQHVRKESEIWCSCTGRGKESLKRSIIAGATLFRNSSSKLKS